jgi:hypothetical protein
MYEHRGPGARIRSKGPVLCLDQNQRQCVGVDHSNRAIHEVIEIAKPTQLVRLSRYAFHIVIRFEAL